MSLSDLPPVVVKPLALAPRPARLGFWQIIAVLVGPLLVCDFLLLPLTVVIKAQDTLAILVYACFGLIISQGVLLCMAHVLGVGGLLTRSAIAWGCGVLAAIVWFGGMLVAITWQSWQRPDFRDAAAILSALPLIALAVQTPLWIGRLVFGWRLAHQEHEEPPPHFHCRFFHSHDARRCNVRDCQRWETPLANFQQRFLDRGWLLGGHLRRRQPASFASAVVARTTPASVEGRGPLQPRRGRCRHFHRLYHRLGTESRAASLELAHDGGFRHPLGDRVGNTCRPGLFASPRLAPGDRAQADRKAQSVIFSLISSEFPRNSGAYIAIARVGSAENCPGISARIR